MLNSDGSAPVRRCGALAAAMLAWCACAQAQTTDWRFRAVPGADDVPLNVVEAGTQGKPGILFVHGFSQSALSWQLQLDDRDLNGAFHLVAFDLRGHGNSGKPWRSEDYSADAWAQDMAAVIEATGLRRPVVVAWSFGGQVVMNYVRRRGAAQIAGLQFVGSAGRLVPLAPASARAASDPEWVADMLSGDWRANRRAALTGVRRLTAEEMPRDWFDLALWTHAAMPVYAKQAIGIRDVDNSDLVSGLQLPVRFSTGELDQLVTPATAEAAAKSLPNASLRIYPGVGHSPFVEAAADFNRDLAEFARQAHAAIVPGAVFSDCDFCPQVIVVPPGEFLMGSNDGEPDRPEGPIHKVAISRGFAIGRYEVTNAQYRAFVADTGHPSAAGCNLFFPDEVVLRTEPGVTWDDPAYGRPPADDEPVVCVSWNDATAYVNWLSGKTGQQYRLPSEAEWAFAARAGAATAYPWGDDGAEACRFGNVYDAGAYHPAIPWEGTVCDDGFPEVSPVGQFEANAFGIHDMVGNVWEWVQDCYIAPYPDAPVDERPFESAGCDRRVSKGGSWRTSITRQRPAFRGRDPDTLVTQIFGFRVARDIETD